MRCYDAALALNPHLSEAYANRGNSRKKLNDLEGALADYEIAVKLNPGNTSFHANKANMLLELLRLPEAIAAYEFALSLHPSNAEAQFGKANALLLMGRFAEGLDAYEWRTRLISTPARTLRPDVPQWSHDDPLAGKSILIHWEQGLGDTFQFCRYVRLFSERDAKVFFSPQRSLFGLMRSIGPEISLIDENQAANGTFDYRIGLLSCPQAFRTRLESIPSSVAYLRADEQRRDGWQERLEPKGFRIGVCWQGDNPEFGRSFDVKHLSAFAGQPSVRLLALQRGTGKDWQDDMPPGLAIEHLGDDLDSGEDAFRDSAAVLSLCDLVISCDTAIAHLAGALGVPTWVALKSVPDWRWMLGRSDSPWYPAMRLFRQSQAGEWSDVFAEMRRALDEMLSSRPA